MTGGIQLASGGVTDRGARAAGHRAVLTGGAGKVGTARYLATARLTRRRHDSLGDHAEIVWRPQR